MKERSLRGNFEYKTMKFMPESGFKSDSFNHIELDIKINLLGQNGWELLTSQNILIGFGSTKKILMTFK